MPPRRRPLLPVRRQRKAPPRHSTAPLWPRPRLLPLALKHLFACLPTPQPSGVSLLPPWPIARGLHDSFTVALRRHTPPPPALLEAAALYLRPRPRSLTTATRGPASTPPISALDGQRLVSRTADILPLASPPAGQHRCLRAAVRGHNARLHCAGETCSRVLVTPSCFVCARHAMSSAAPRHTFSAAH